MLRLPTQLTRNTFLSGDAVFIYVIQDKEPKGIIPLENIQIREVQDAKKQYCFELFSINNEVRRDSELILTLSMLFQEYSVDCVVNVYFAGCR